MIRRITEQAELDAALEKLPNDLFSGKIRSLARAYGFLYDFTKFYISDRGGIIADYYSAAVLAGNADEETADFCRMAGFTEILMPESIYFSAFDKFPAGRDNIMRFEGRREPLPTEVRVDPPYEEFLEIIKEAFEHELSGWYVDTCHRVRHGITSLYIWDGASAECVFAENGIAYLTMVAVKKEMRGKDRGKRLVKAVSAHLARENEVFLICRDDLIEFYRKADFIKAGNCYTVNLK